MKKRLFTLLELMASIGLIMVLAAIITPPDIMTLILVTIPLYLLFEVSIGILKRMEKAKS